MRFGTATSQPISCVVMNFAIGANSALMIASNPPTASFAIPPVTPPSRPPNPPSGPSGLKLVGPIGSALAAGGETAQSSSPTVSTAAPRRSSFG